VAVLKVSLDVVLNTLKLVLELFRVSALEYYLALHKKPKIYCAKYVGN